MRMRRLLLATSNVRKLHRILVRWHEIQGVVPANPIRDYADVMPADQLMERFLKATINTWRHLGTLFSHRWNKSRLWSQTGLCSDLKNLKVNGDAPRLA